jgi:putative hydrolases of HD superfamily
MSEAKLYAKRLLDLQDEILKFVNIKRQLYLPDNQKGYRRENDVEHSYNLALSAWYLSQFFPELDQIKVIKYALAHDLVEIHAGDVMAIGRTENQERIKKLKEKEAYKQIKKDWPDFNDLTNSIKDYENKESKEAKFVYALDKLLPLLNNLLTNGMTWKKHDMKKTDVIKNKSEKTKTSPEIYKIWLELYKKLDENPEYFNS